MQEVERSKNSTFCAKKKKKIPGSVEARVYQVLNVVPAVEKKTEKRMEVEQRKNNSYTFIFEVAQPAPYPDLPRSPLDLKRLMISVHKVTPVTFRPSRGNSGLFLACATSHTVST